MPIGQSSARAGASGNDLPNLLVAVTRLLVHQFHESVAGNQEAPPEPDGRQFAHPGSLVGQSPTDSEDLSRLLDSEGELFHVAPFVMDE